MIAWTGRSRWPRPDDRSKYAVFVIVQERKSAKSKLLFLPLNLGVTKVKNPHGLLSPGTLLYWTELYSKSTSTLQKYTPPASGSVLDHNCTPPPQQNPVRDVTDLRYLKVKGGRSQEGGEEQRGSYVGRGSVE